MHIDDSRLVHSHTPLVSVILCTYNRAGYLRRCIDSVIRQDFQDWELIVVDDGSTDETFDIVNPYIQQYHQIRYMKHQNRGLALARNLGIQAAIGHYITFIDSDDQYTPEHLSARITFMETHPEIDLISGGFQTDEDIWVKDYFHPDQRIHIRDCVLGPTFFGRRSMFFALQGFSAIAYGEDIELWTRAERMFRLQKLTEPETYIYQRAADSITRQATQPS